MHHQKNLTYLIRGLGFQKIMRNYLYKGNSARIYMIFKFYRTAIIQNIRSKDHSKTIWIKLFSILTNLILKLYFITRSFSHTSIHRIPILSSRYLSIKNQYNISISKLLLPQTLVIHLYVVTYLLSATYTIYNKSTWHSNIIIAPTC